LPGIEEIKWTSCDFGGFMNIKNAQTVKQKLLNKEFLSMPGIFDMISAKIADQFDFDCLYMTGYGAVSSLLGLPDAGLATYTDMVGRVKQITTITNTPLIADADTGYGGLLNVEHTVRGYEDAGAIGLQLEDQEFPKKCGHVDAKRPIIDLDDAVNKIKVAAASRSTDDFLIVARTDAYSDYGFKEALRRASAYDKAGADILFIEGPESIDEMKEITRSFDKPILVNMADGGRTPILSASELQEIGFAAAIFPATGFLAAGEALRQSYQYLFENKTSKGIDVPMHDFKEFSNLMGFDHVAEFEKKWASD
jgi:2,3-dimethylmalate lyase